MNHEQLLIDEIDTALRSLELLFPIAGDKLDQLCTMYTATYMLKLRAMKC
jgi:hypothetical protein